MIITRADAKRQGLSEYVSGSVCPRGNVASRRTSTGSCLCLKCTAARNEQKRIAANVRYASDPDHRKSVKAKANSYYENNTEKAKKAQSKNREANREKGRAYSREYRIANPEKMRRLHRAWSRKNKENVAIRRILYRVLQKIGCKKEGKTEDVLGYSAADLKQHMTKQFVDGMSWDNYGEWHIDHIVSIKQLIDEGVADPARINCLSNLMPIWALDNHQKNAQKRYLI